MGNTSLNGVSGLMVDNGGQRLQYTAVDSYYSTWLFTLAQINIECVDGRTTMKVTIHHARAKLATPLYVSACACMALLLLLKYGFTNAGRFALNTTASLSRGLYTLTSTPTDPIALFCPSGPEQAVAIKRKYRDQSGECPDGYISLLKPIAARAGDTVVFSARGVRVNGVLLPNSAPQSVDRYERPLSHWPFGTYVVAAGTFWAISTHNPRSYDSRYFGPVSVAAIKRYAHPTVVFP